MKILAGDIGGTKTILQLSHYANGEFTMLAEERFESSLFTTFDEVLDRFISNNQEHGSNLDSACIGVAGPVENQQANVTNLPWRLDSKLLAAKGENRPLLSRTRPRHRPSDHPVTTEGHRMETHQRTPYARGGDDRKPR